MRQRVLGEFLGTGFLLCVVVGSGIMGQNLSEGNTGVVLLANSLATGAGLFVLIQCLGPVSGAHFNPVVSLVENLWGRLDRKTLFAYWAAQFTGAILGVWVTHAMFGREIFQSSLHHRAEPGLWLSEMVATFGLICTIGLAGRKRVEVAPMAIALYIVATYWFTSSTSFANPAVTLARTFTNTFCGIEAGGVLPFIIAQAIGAVLAFFLLKKLPNS
jgi:glycerol uptake facilitator-like aquaporin